MDNKFSIHHVAAMNPINILSLNYNDELFSEQERNFIRPFLTDDYFKRSRTNNLSHSMDVLSQPELSRLKKIFDEAIMVYTRDILKLSNVFQLTNSWLTKNESGDYHHQHNHPNVMLSITTYFDETFEYLGPFAPIVIETPGLAHTFSTFQFQTTPFEYDTVNGNEFGIYPNKNQFIIFPGHLYHQTMPNQSDKVRYCLAANYFIDGVIQPGNSYAAALKISMIPNTEFKGSSLEGKDEDDFVVYDDKPV
jgi:hypothetical protein